MLLIDATLERSAYKALGFGLIGSKLPSLKGTALFIKASRDLVGFFWTWITNFATLSAVPMNRFGIPNNSPIGVLQLGGTVVIDDNKVLFSWADEVPGAHPDVQDVLKAIGIH